MAMDLRCLLALGYLAGALLAPGCKPEMPTAGGLVATDRPAEQGATSPIASAAPVPVAVEPSGFPSAESLPIAASSPQEPSIPLAANPGLIPVDEASRRGQPGADQTPAGSRSAASGFQKVAAIRLTAGVAVPQSLPTGTVMAMSVDYAIAGPLNQSSRYVWVAASQDGGSTEVAVQLQESGTLQAFFLKLRPEHRPFHCHIEEVSPGGRRTRVSNVATMQTNY